MKEHCGCCRTTAVAEVPDDVNVHEPDETAARSSNPSRNISSSSCAAVPEIEGTGAGRQEDHEVAVVVGVVADKAPEEVVGDKIAVVVVQTAVALIKTDKRSQFEL